MHYKYTKSNTTQILYEMCKNYSFKVNVQAKKFSFSFPLFPPPTPSPTGGREKGMEKLDFAAKTLSLNKQYLHSSHQICVEKYYFVLLMLVEKIVFFIVFK